MKNQHDLVLRYVLDILSIFEKTFQTTKSKLTNEKTDYNQWTVTTDNYKWPPTTRNHYLQQEGKQQPTPKD